MSTYDDASLIYYPSGYKAGKAYSLKPTDGSGDLTFTRASTATRVNESGLIEEVATGVPRIDYTGGGCGKLLLEPQRTNVITYSEELSSSFAVSGGSITSNTTISPDGTTNADTFTPDGTGIGARIQILTFNLTANIYTASIFAKADVNDTIAIEFALFTGGSGTVRSFFDLTSGTTPTSEAKIENYGDGWYRCTSAPYTISAGDTVGRLYVNSTPSDTVQLWPTAAASNGQSVILWGAQAELGSYSTSYIPTSGTAVTRVADKSSTTGLGSIIGQAEGTIYLEGIAANINADLVGINRSTSNSILIITSSTNFLRVYVYAGGVNLTFTDTIANRPYYKLAITYKSGASYLYINGVKIGATNTSTFTFSAPLNLLELAGNYFVGVNEQKIQGLMIFQTAKSEAELAALTTL